VGGRSVSGHSDDAPQHRPVVCASASAVQLGAQATCRPPKGRL